MYMLSGVVLVLGLLWALSAIAWAAYAGKPVAFPQDGLASGALPGRDYKF
jgi:hypothetical protein